MKGGYGCENGHLEGAFVSFPTATAAVCGTRQKGKGQRNASKITAFGAILHAKLTYPNISHKKQNKKGSKNNEIQDQT